MFSTIVNGCTIVVGALLGELCKKAISKRLADVLMQGLGLCVILIGMQSALKTQNIMIAILSMVLGGIVGVTIGIEKRLDQAGEALQKKFNQKSNSDMGKAFVTATLLFCVGSMAIVGALDAGLRQNHATLLAKAVLDGMTSMILAGTLGIGVIFAAGVVVVYQGSIALLSAYMAPLLSEALMAEMSAVGGLLIIGLGLNMIRDKKLPIADLLPAIFFAPLLYQLVLLCKF